MYSFSYTTFFKVELLCCQVRYERAKIGSTPVSRPCCRTPAQHGMK